MACSLTASATTVVPSDSAAFGTVAASAPPMSGTGGLLNVQTFSPNISSAVPGAGKGIGINTTTDINGKPCGSTSDNPSSQNINPSAATPYNMPVSASNTATTVNTAGFYLISYQAALQATSNSATVPIYFWIDEWISLPSGTSVRTLFTGDSPDEISSTASAYPVYLYTIVYLSSGSIVYYPRIWFITASTPTVCVYGSSAPTGTPASTFSVTLLSRG